MAVPPHLSSLKFALPAAPRPTQTKHTIELFLDYCCPFSARMFKTLWESVLPLIRAQYGERVDVIMRPQVQPWHPSSTLMHEAALAVARHQPDRFWAFAAALFAHQREFFDEAVVDELRNATYDRLVRLAVDECDIDKSAADELLKLLQIKNAKEAANKGNGVTDDLKLITKMNRLVGVHATPTVIFDGVVNPSIESSWDKAKWEDFLKEKCGDQK